MISNRKAFLLIFLLCLCSLLYALYAQYYQGVIPCPLCIAQRIIIGLTGILALIFGLHSPKNFLVRIYGIIIIAVTMLCVKTAITHLQIMHLPPDKQPVSCGMPIEILFQRLPLHNFIAYIFKGDAECGKISWTIFGINAPTAVIILCSIIAILGLIVVFSKHKTTNHYK